MLKIYNSLTKKVETFKALNPPKVGLYTCGPTVYDFPHIGHGRKYVMDDILKRELTAVGYEVDHVQNVTDVGHLESDEDEGEDKLVKGAKREGKSVWDIAKYYEEEFYRDMDALNIIRPSTICRATEHIKDQIGLVKKLIKKGFAYDTDEAVYFDISKVKNYNIFDGQSLDDKQVAVRESVQKGKYKKHPADFALWFKCVDRFADHTMQWKSPWGIGFPGWHIECSAMSMKYLGDTIDIHTGGIDHIPVHHPNEIAQSESATGKQFVRFWIHHEHLMVNGQKMSKSKKNFYRLKDVVEKGYDPMDLRYLYLTTHYRKTQNFTWEALDSAREARMRLVGLLHRYRHQPENATRSNISLEKLGQTKDLRKKFELALEHDLNTAQALAVVWEVVKSNISSEDKYDLIVSFDAVLGLKLTDNLDRVQDNKVPDEVHRLVAYRNKLRLEKKWKKADSVRDEILHLGYEIEDGIKGTIIKKS